MSDAERLLVHIQHFENVFYPDQDSKDAAQETITACKDMVNNDLVRHFLRRASLDYTYPDMPMLDLTNFDSNMENSITKYTTPKGELDQESIDGIALARSLASNEACRTIIYLAFQRLEEEYRGPQ